MSDWQPIETAHRDGTPFFGTDRRHIATFYWEDVAWADGPRFWQIGCTAFQHDVETHDWDGPVWFEPTLWMDLPKPLEKTS